MQKLVISPNLRLAFYNKAAGENTFNNNKLP